MMRGMACALIALLAPPVVQPAAAAGADSTWTWHAGHSYSSVSALRQPATLVVSADAGRPVLTVFNLAFLAQGPLGNRGGLDLGVRAAGGSARPRPARVFGGIVRGWGRWDRFDRLVLSGAAEYEADGGFDVQTGALDAEATWTHGPPGLGRPLHRAFPLRWRPWVGVEYGTVLADNRDADADVLERGGFVRGRARVEARYAIEPANGLAAGWTVEWTGWLLGDADAGKQFVETALAVPVRAGLSVSADLGIGRKPPLYEYERRIGMGVGWRR